MKPLYMLLIYIAVYAILGYLLIRVIFEILKLIIERTKGSLHVLFLFGAITAGLFAIVNREKAPEYLEKIQFWKDYDGNDIYSVDYETVF